MIKKEGVDLSQVDEPTETNWRDSPPNTLFLKDRKSGDCDSQFSGMISEKENTNDITREEEETRRWNGSSWGGSLHEVM